MATDMQPFLKTVSSAAKQTPSEMRDRNASVAPSSFADRFDTLLGRAESRRVSGQPSVAARPKSAAPSHTPAHSAINSPTHSPTDKLSGTAANARQEGVSNKSEPNRTQKEDSDSGQDEQTTEVHEKTTQSATLSPEILIAAGIASQALTGEPPAGQAASLSEGAGKSADATVGEVPSAPATGLSSADSQSGATTQSVPALPPGQTVGHMPADTTANADVTRSAEPAQTSNIPRAETGNADASQVSQSQNQTTLPETRTSLSENSIKEAQIEPEKSTLAAAVVSAHMTEKPAPGAAQDPGDLQSQFDSVMRVSDISTGQNASSAGQFSGKEFSSSPDSRSDPDHPKSNLLPSEDNSLRPQFLDQTTGVSPSAPPSGDSRVGRHETGQTIPIHASESERISELRGTYPSPQTVTLDLDPLDMGPLRVRIMMTDQTVHAHIRTAHGELGQGLLQQGQSLEASLRTTGLEMGMLRVTVDQQQQGRGDNAWAFQQQPGRPGLASGLPSAPGEEERASRAEHGIHNSGRVSFFA
ncbi:MAG: flagellar hook-length control protein FliK [Nitrospira sp.]